MSDILFNDNWQFMLKDNGSQLSDAVSEADWHDVEVPHDWLIGDTENLYKSGDGWYRKKFVIDDLKDNQVFYLRFGGVYMNSTVYVNGIEAGGRHYGYSCFSLDITPFVKHGENEIFVRVRYEAPNSRWYSGAGIIRSVFLRRTDSCHTAENGVYISPKKTGDKWLVTIDTRVIGEGCSVKHTVTDKKGTILAKAVAKKSGDIYSARFYALNPKLWDTESPELYSLLTEVIKNGEVCDSARNTFGFRTTEFNPQKGFFLNGIPTKLKGVCMHHDLGALGAAMNKNALKRQLKILKSYGVNAVRTSHNMPARELIDLCNEMGIMVDSECFDMWEIPKTDYDYARFFDEDYEKDVESWVCRDRNDPCVIMWSIGNEILDTHKSERGLEVAQMLCTAVRKFDYLENAACTIASNYMRWENAQKVADYVKLAGYNYAEDLYDDHHEKYPDWFIYGSETASTVRSRGIYHLPAYASILTHEDMQCSDMGNSVVGWGKNQEKALIDDRDREYCGGQFVWTGFDYIGEPTPYSTKNSYFGIVDTAGFPKESYYLYKAFWTKPEAEPFVHILPCWDFNIGEEITVYTYSNLKTVELIHNGRSLGKQSVDFEHGDKLHCEWTFSFKRGTVTANAYDDKGNIVATDMVSSFGDSVSIDAIPSKYILNADGRDLIFFEVTAVDKNGIPVANARNRINVTVEGPARLVGLDNGDSTDYDSYKGSNKRLFSGKLLAIVQSTFESGEVTVSFRSEGLWGKVVTVSALPAEKPEGVSVVSEYYPFKAQEYKPEVPLRKIELYTTKNLLEPSSPTAGITAKLYPENADYKDISFSCILLSGVEVGLSEIEKTSYGAKVTAKGDGSYIIRAVCNNGGKYPQITSDIRMRNDGFGEMNVNPYGFISASLSDCGTKPLNIIERGAVGGISGRTVIGFQHVDFGVFGSDRLILSIGYCGEDKPLAVELWIGDPDNGGHFVTTLSFENNGVWDGFAPQEFRLPERLSGIIGIAFVVSAGCIFGGFEFIKPDKAYEQLSAASYDEIYGDEYKVEGSAVVGIGNNVLLNFNDMDFGEGTEKLTICGSTPNDVNAFQLRYSDDNGVQQTQLISFSGGDAHEQTFTLEKISGKRNISFVFLPGSRFDFNWFRFEK